MPDIDKIILGTAQFGLNYGINNTTGKPDEVTINKILITAHNAGIQCLDTAQAYGTAHEAIGNFHEHYPQSIFKIITKLPNHITDVIGETIEKYLQQLRVDQLEALLFHSYQSYTENLESIKLLKGYKKTGKIKYLGVSVYTNKQIEKVINDDDIDIIQFPFNLFDNLNLRGEILTKAKQNNKIIHTRSTFLQGLFFNSPQKPNKISEALSYELDYINDLSRQSSILIQKMALNYCLQQNNIDNVLIGVDTLSQLQQNLADANYSLPQNVIDKINNLHINNIDLLNPSLWSQ